MQPDDRPKIVLHIHNGVPQKALTNVGWLTIEIIETYDKQASDSIKDLPVVFYDDSETLQERMSDLWHDRDKG